MRRRYSGQVVEEHAKDVIAAEYRHTTARGVQRAEAPDPQLHSHVVITERRPRGRADRRGRVAADLPLAHGSSARTTAPRSRDELAQRGYAIERGTGKHGRYFEIAGVPRGLLRGVLRRAAARSPEPPSASAPS